jgi:hypothetical protein
LTDVGALVFAVLIDILKFLEGLDDVDVVAEVYDYVLRALMETVV